MDTQEIANNVFRERLIKKLEKHFEHKIHDEAYLEAELRIAAKKSELSYQNLENLYAICEQEGLEPTV